MNQKSLLQLVYSTETLLFVRMIADYTDTSISPWHPFKKFRHVQVEILHSQHHSQAAIFTSSLLRTRPLQCNG